MAFVTCTSNQVNATRPAGAKSAACSRSMEPFMVVGLLTRRKTVRFAVPEHASADAEHTQCPVVRPGAEKVLEEYGQFLAQQAPEDFAEFVKHPCFYPENALGLCSPI
ncbi:hypothetical protein FVE85_5474 [Porphyridium purpureum]|uniref:Uncharacterized protein n=1 Tax=Porphyridium purpureum TaxID=35688 RepID=A0A5J4Z1V3_PORPP|nr:hypothetical protein FVE85_5474 [Porphyridium purpureum]|eukprot:POR9004..scf295_1